MSSFLILALNAFNYRSILSDLWGYFERGKMKELKKMTEEIAAISGAGIVPDCLSSGSLFVSYK